MKRIIINLGEDDGIEKVLFSTFFDNVTDAYLKVTGIFRSDRLRYFFVFDPEIKQQELHYEYHSFSEAFGEYHGLSFKEFEKAVNKGEILIVSEDEYKIGMLS
jgi:hypothetical protein